MALQPEVTQAHLDTNLQQLKAADGLRQSGEAEDALPAFPNRTYLRQWQQSEIAQKFKQEPGFMAGSPAHIIQTITDGKLFNLIKTVHYHQEQIRSRLSQQEVTTLLRDELLSIISMSAERVTQSTAVSSRRISSDPHFSFIDFAQTTSEQGHEQYVFIARTRQGQDPRGDLRVTITCTAENDLSITVQRPHKMDPVHLNNILADIGLPSLVRLVQENVPANGIQELSIAAADQKTELLLAELDSSLGMILEKRHLKTADASRSLWRLPTIEIEGILFSDFLDQMLRQANLMETGSAQNNNLTREKITVAFKEILEEYISENQSPENPSNALLGKLIENRLMVLHLLMFLAAEGAVAYQVMFKEYFSEDLTPDDFGIFLLISVTLLTGFFSQLTIHEQKQAVKK